MLIPVEHGIWFNHLNRFFIFFTLPACLPPFVKESSQWIVDTKEEKEKTAMNIIRIIIVMYTHPARIEVRLENATQFSILFYFAVQSSTSALWNSILDATRYVHQGYSPQPFRFSYIMTPSSYSSSWWEFFSRFYFLNKLWGFLSGWLTGGRWWGRTKKSSNRIFMKKIQKEKINNIFMD